MGVWGGEGELRVIFTMEGEKSGAANLPLLTLTASVRMSTTGILSVAGPRCPTCLLPELKDARLRH